MDLGDENIAIQIGLLIKEKRKSKKLNQKQLAVLLNGKESDHGLISRIENGERENVRFDTVYMILLALDIDLIEILNTIKT